MTLALYRKYRPRTFAEVIGQEHVTEPLIQALRTGRLHHAYLFSGPRGCGKTSSARILARSLNCEKGPTPEPCGECESCRALAPDGPGSIDVIEIDAASHGGVDDARDLREKAVFAPVSSRYKVYIVDEAHMVSSAGFNALLKLVEEPPDYVKFIFATTEPDKVLGTIRSRTHHYPFRLIPPGVLRPHLERLCAAEGVSVEPAVFPLVIRAGGGSVRDTLSVLDQLIAGAGPEGVTYARAVALLGATDRALIDEMCEALAAGDGAAAFVTVNRVVEAGHDPRRFAADLLERLRDLIVLQRVPDAAEKGLIDAPADQLERMRDQARRLGPGTLSRCADIVHNGLVEMRGTTAPRLLLELVTARMFLPGADDSTSALLQRLERLERQAASGAPTVAAHAAPPADVATAPSQPVAAPSQPAAVSTPPARPPSPAPEAAPAAEASPPAPPRAAAQPAGTTAPPASPEPRRAAPAARPQPAPPPSPPAGAVPTRLPARGADLAAVQRAWDEILKRAGRRRQRTAALARQATIRDVVGDTLVLTCEYPAHATMLADAAAPLVEAIYEVLGVRWQVVCEVAGEQHPPSTRAAGARPARPSAAPRPGASAAGHAGRTTRPASGAGDDWPEPVRPGGAGPGAAAEEDWPTPAVPGGAAASSAPSAGDSASPARGPIPAARGGTDGVAAPTPRGHTAPAAVSPPPASPSSASAPPAAASLSPRSDATVTAPVTPEPWSDGTLPEDPPDDVEYDIPDAEYAAFDGFSPDDDVLDEEFDAPAEQQISEQEALRLLTEELGAEKIGEEELR
ncbi:MAG TPA: DNA polymerase III subunit gamma and tau [Micromonospora sp.]